MSERKRILVTGATGFVGAHLHERLLALGHDVRGGTRHPERAATRHPGRTYVRCDVGDEASLRAALSDVQCAYYLVHGMAEGEGYEAREVEGARRFAALAAEAGLSSMIYLGGAQPTGPLSRHLRSRLRTGEALRQGKVPTLELRPSMIIGAGSESFRIVRDLAARLPFMVLPRWLRTKTQPIALEDVLYALVRALDVPLSRSAVYTLPGPEALSGRDILMRTAALFDMEPRIVGVPFVTPRLSSYWITLVTRANKRVSRELVEGLMSDLLAPDLGFWALFPQHERLSFEEAVRRALADPEERLSWPGRMAERLVRKVAHHAEPR